MNFSRVAVQKLNQLLGQGYEIREVETHLSDFAETWVIIAKGEEKGYIDFTGRVTWEE